MGESYDLGRRIGELTYRIKNLEQIVENYALVRSKEKGEFEVLKTSGIQLSEGDRVGVTAGGGGGYGSPLERDAERVRMDVINGYVSIDKAREEYGVEIDPDTFDIDLDVTQNLRRG